MIEAKDVSFVAGDRPLVDGITLSVEPGEVLAVVGPNGAGKSTLLRLLTGELVPTSGAVHLGGRPLSAWTLAEQALRRAVLPQHSDLAFPLACSEVVLLGRSPHFAGRETAHDIAVVRLAMLATDTLAFADRSYPTLSGGERQRVQAARAIAQIWGGSGFRVLVLDEPTASLDPAHQHGMLRLAQRMAADRCAVVCVLHDLNLAAQYATRIAVLHRGRLAAEGKPLRVLSGELLSEVFDLDALVVPHPELSCPLIVARGPIVKSGPINRAGDWQ